MQSLAASCESNFSLLPNYTVLKLPQQINYINISGEQEVRTDM